VSPVSGTVEELDEFRSWADVAREARRKLRRQRTEDWRTLSWKKVQRDVRRLQQRIYQAERRGDWKRARSIERLLLHSWSGRCLAVRQVTQDNRGKRTPGVDGVAKLPPSQRLKLARRLCHLTDWEAAPIRRVYIPKPGSTEKRGLGIPMLRSHCTSYNRLWDFALGRSASPAYPVYHQSIILTSDVTSVVASAYAVWR
jgi:Arc/MetJ-type ribon-helix-helix transcriptional regulator